MLFRLAVNLLRLWQMVWPFPRGTGTVVRAVGAATRAGLIEPRWCRVKETWYRIDLTEADSRQILLDPGHEREVVEALLAHLPARGTFIDVGANVGYMTLAASRQVGPDGRVCAIEPNPETAAVLRSNIDRNRARNIAVFELACAEAPSTARLFLNRAHPGRSSLSRQNGGTDNSVTVACEPLDRIAAACRFERVDLIKIDVEGAELRVLEGMKDILSRFRPALVLEIAPALLASFGTAPPDIERFLGGYGYAGKPIDSTNVCFRPATANNSL